MKIQINRFINKVNKINLLWIIIFFLSCISLIPCSEVYAQDSPEKPISGKELFIKNRCVNCHTIGRGRFVGPDLAGVGSRYRPDEIKKWMENSQEVYQSKGKMPVNEGYPPMPPLGVSPEDAELITDYLLSVKTIPVSKAQGAVIKGRVVNATSKELSEEIELTLTAYLGDRARDGKKVKTSSDGSFDFSDLAWDRSYTISLNYKGAEYVTDKMVFYPEEYIKTLDLPIYEPTQSDKYISVKADHVIIQISKAEIAVAEIMVFHNGGKEIYIGKEGQNGTREALRFDLPKGAGNVQFLDGLEAGSVIQTARGFVDTSSFAPGVRRVVYAYALPFKSGKNIIEKRFNYMTEGLVLLASDSGLNVSVDGLSEGNTANINNDRFLRWTGKGFKAGTSIRLEIGKPFLGEDWLKWVAFGTVLMLLGGAVLYSFIIRKGTKSVKEDNSYSIEEEELEKERRNLIQQIAELDDRFQDREMTEEEYMRARSKSKEKLIEITHRIKRN